jgi:hypothetical protein
MMRRTGRVFARVVLLLLASVTLAAFWFGLVPQRLSPFSPISLNEPSHWFLDARLATLRYDPPLCHATLSAPDATASPIAARPYKNGCGWSNGVNLASAGGAQVGANPITCEMAVAAALWVKHEVQPAAQEILGTRVTQVRDMGTYDCRNIIGRKVWQDTRSQHATANAWDIAGFTLADGRTISVQRDWRGSKAEARFLHEVHRRACRYFRVALSPNFNAAHHDHFHFDRGPLWTCR